IPFGRYISANWKDGEMVEDLHLGLYCSSHNSGVDLSDIPQHIYAIFEVACTKERGRSKIRVFSHETAFN
ncbi:hypothetical protein ACTXT7_014566, partial [Hymenolepis weldensis]